MVFMVRSKMIFFVQNNSETQEVNGLFIGIGLHICDSF